MTKKAGGGSRNWGKVGSEIMEESELAVDPVRFHFPFFSIK